MNALIEQTTPRTHREQKTEPDATPTSTPATTTTTAGTGAGDVSQAAPQAGKLTITVHGARDLRSSQFVSSLTPLVSVTWSGDEAATQRTPVQRHGDTAPVWNHSITIDIDDVSRKGQTITVCVVNKSAASEVTFARRVIELNHFIDSTERKWFQLFESINPTRKAGLLELSGSWSPSPPPPPPKPKRRVEEDDY